MQFNLRRDCMGSPAPAPWPQPSPQSSTGQATTLLTGVLPLLPPPPRGVQAAHVTHEETGTLAYQLSFGEEPDSLLIYERYTSKEYLETVHWQSEVRASRAATAISHVPCAALRTRTSGTRTWVPTTHATIWNMHAPTTAALPVVRGYCHDRSRRLWACTCHGWPRRPCMPPNAIGPACSTGSGSARAWSAPSRANPHARALGLDGPGVLSHPAAIAPAPARCPLPAWTCPPQPFKAFKVACAKAEIEWVSKQVTKYHEVDVGYMQRQA